MNWLMFGMYGEDYKAFRRFIKRGYLYKNYCIHWNEV